MGKIVNQTELAAIMGVSDVTLWQWGKDGMPHTPGENGKANVYDTSAVITWKINTEVGKVRKENPNPRDELYVAQRRLVDLQIAEKEGKLVSADELEAEFTRMVTLARQRFLQLAGSIPMDDATRRALIAGIEDALKEVSRHEPGEDSDTPGVGELGPADPPLAGGMG